MNYWLVAILSLIFTGVSGTCTVNMIGNHLIDLHTVANWGVSAADGKKVLRVLTLQRFFAAILCGLTASGLACLIFSVIKLIGG